MSIKTNFTILFVLLFCSLLRASEQDILSKSEELVLAGKRIEALKLLVKDYESATKVAQKKLLQNKVIQLSELFLTEDGMKEFESSKSYYPEKRDKSLQLAHKALESEPGNILVLRHLIVLLLAENRCGEALTKVKASLRLNPFDEKTQALRHLVNYCRGQKTVVPPSLAKKFVELNFLGISEDHKKHPEQAMESLRKAREVDPEYPPLFYWQWKMAQTESDRLEKAQRYLQFCNANGPKRQYLVTYPCKNLAELKAYVQSQKKVENE